MRVRWSIQARDDLLKIGDYIAADDPRAARLWVEKLRERARRAGRTPGSGRIVPRFERDDVRKIFFRTYRIVYRVLTREILVITVREGHKLTDDVDPDTD